MEQDGETCTKTRALGALSLCRALSDLEAHLSSTEESLLPAEANPSCHDDLQKGFCLLEVELGHVLYGVGTVRDGARRKSVAADGMRHAGLNQRNPLLSYANDVTACEHQSLVHMPLKEFFVLHVSFSFWLGEMFTSGR